MTRCEASRPTSTRSGTVERARQTLRRTLISDTLATDIASSSRPRLLERVNLHGSTVTHAVNGR